MKLLDKLKNYFSNIQVIEAEVPDSYEEVYLRATCHWPQVMDSSRCPVSFDRFKHVYTWGIGYNFNYTPTETRTDFIKVKIATKDYKDFSLAEIFFLDYETNMIYRFENYKFIRANIEFVSYIAVTEMREPYPIIQ